MENLSRSFFWLLFVAVSLALVFLLRDVLLPFLIAGLIAYLGDPIADKLERIGVSRTGSAVIVFLIFAFVFFIALLLLVPMIAAQIDLFMQVLPSYISWFQETVLPWFNAQLASKQGAEFEQGLQQALQQNWQKAGNLFTALLANVTRSGLAVIGWFGSLVLIPVVAFYLLRDWDVLLAHIEDLLPRSQSEKARRIARECDEVLSAFLRGQLLIMLALGMIYSVGLWLLGLDLGLLIGMAAGLASVVPYLGAAVGITAALVAAVVQFHDWLPLLLVAAVFGFGQLVESLFLTPVLVGDKIGLHPVAVIFAVLAGGQLFGFIGILLALPVAAVMMVMLRHAHRSYRQSVFYHN
jgi:predicted PurR-regulated permease PerM